MQLSKKSYNSKHLPILSKNMSQNMEEFFIEDRIKEDPIALTIENEDNFENVVIKEEIKRELTSFKFWGMVLIASFQNVSLLYFYMNFKLIFLKVFDDDHYSTKVATFVEFVGRMAKINSNFVFDIFSLNFVFYSLYTVNLIKNVAFIFYGSVYWVFLLLYILQKIIEGLYYIYNFVYIFQCFENKGSFLMKIFELHKLISLMISTTIVYHLGSYFDFERTMSVLVFVDIIGLIAGKFE